MIKLASLEFVGGPADGTVIIVPAELIALWADGGGDPTARSYWWGVTTLYRFDLVTHSLTGRALMELEPRVS
jgi:hypothetical protein